MRRSGVQIPEAAPIVQLPGVAEWNLKLPLNDTPPLQPKRRNDPLLVGPPGTPPLQPTIMKPAWESAGSRNRRLTLCHRRGFRSTGPYRHQHRSIKASDSPNRSTTSGITRSSARGPGKRCSPRARPSARDGFIRVEVPTTAVFDLVEVVEDSGNVWT